VSLPFLALLLCARLVLAESSIVLRDVDLRKDPFNDAPAVGTIKQETAPSKSCCAKARGCR